MAKKRMFDKTIVDSDAFLDMPLSSQALYFHLNMRADDEGFINNPKRITRLIGASDDDFKILIMKKFVIPFDTGIIVIKHWKINNYLRGDRVAETLYTYEKSMLKEKPSGAYELINKGLNEFGIPNDNQMTTIGIPSIEESSIEENSIKEDILSDSGESDDAPFGVEDEKETNDNKIPYKEIIDYLNEIVGTHYRHTSASTKAKIRARYNDGFTIGDFKKVIDTKHMEWKNDSIMRKYLRPDTLFGTKFESYLNQDKVVLSDGKPKQSLAGTKDKYGCDIL